jgi:hypothetical protein
MAISITRYVDITSGVGGAAAFATRDFILRAFSSNPLIPTNSFVTMTTIDDVGGMFGFQSEEYRIANFYFGFVSKNIKKPRMISFSSYTPTTRAATVIGTSKTQAVSTYSAITNGTFTVTINGVSATITGVDLSTATSLTNVATLLEAAIQANGGVGFTGATVTWNATAKKFILVSGYSGVGTIDVGGTTAATDVGNLTGLQGGLNSAGITGQTPVEAISLSAGASNNFGTFYFMDDLTLLEREALAAWNKAQNVNFIYVDKTTVTDAQTDYDALKNYGGTAITLSPIATEYPELAPALVLAATDYTATNGTQNYMFYQFGVTPSVSTNADADTYDAIRVNYYGVTQQAGRLVSFYQRGQLMGLPVDPIDMNVYANEMWLKDTVITSVMNLFLALPKISANATGGNQILLVINNAISQALNNGVISIDKTLTVIQQAYITQISGDDTAWRKVQNDGYWVGYEIQTFVNSSGANEYKFVYTLIYSKDDVIRKVEGSHVLI